MSDPVDFSSFSPNEEKAFVPFERTMRENAKRAFTIGFGIAGGVLVVAAAVVLFLYTPCSNFCEHPPGTCTTDAQVAAFKANCESACRSLEHESSLPIVRELKDEKTGKMNESKDSVGGTEFVQTLAACAFSGGGGTTCEGVTKIAEGKGLWCPKK